MKHRSICYRYQAVVVILLLHHEQGIDACRVLLASVAVYVPVIAL